MLDEHLAAAGLQSAAIGCVPWLTSAAVIDRLEKFGSLCVVIDKGAENRDAVTRLLGVEPDDIERGFPNSAVRRLADRLPASDGDRLVVGPYTPREEIEHLIEPIRVVGWRAGGYKPILHAKMLVMGRILLKDYGHPDYGIDEQLEFEPMSVWWGSANWTDGSLNHLEVGSVTTDAGFLAAATDFVADVIAFSEPLGSDCAGPEPNLLSYEVDDAAMWEASERSRLDHLEGEDYDEP
ncbi:MULTISPECIES: hypothetical protein [unclassified Mycolicibacterium]|uniref:hypothetical protein n=1 Tax=unclassified Mycolicibacterium TaxID=2636767 RepID=UPI001EE3B4A0|nr:MULTISPECIES: hypothetical protein [unclassified Mycolicibacterium]